MSYPQPANFTTANPGDAWWGAYRDGNWYVCEFNGFATTAQIQSMLYQGVAPGTRTFDGTTLANRVRIDGVVGPETLRGLWAYARSFSDMPLAILTAIEQAARSRTVTADAYRAGIWLCWFHSRAVHIDVGQAGARSTVSRIDQPLLWAATFEQTRFGAPITLPHFLERPGVPVVSPGVLYDSPHVIQIDAAGNIVGTAPMQPAAPQTPPPNPADSNTSQSSADQACVSLFGAEQPVQGVSAPGAAPTMQRFTADDYHAFAARHPECATWATAQIAQLGTPPPVPAPPPVVPPVAPRAAPASSALGWIVPAIAGVAIVAGVVVMLSAPKRA